MNATQTAYRPVNTFKGEDFTFYEPSRTYVAFMSDLRLPPGAKMTDTLRIVDEGDAMTTYYRFVKEVINAEGELLYVVYRNEKHDLNVELFND